MIAVDTSALIAILFLEPEAEAFQHRLSLEEVCRSAVTLQEASMVLAGRLRDETALEELDDLVRITLIEVVWPNSAAWPSSASARAASGGPEFRRLRLVCAGQTSRHSAALQGHRSRQDRHRSGVGATRLTRARRGDHTPAHATTLGGIARCLR
ncbi:MAG TPA: type II toxin-antitoxin system VapC family toxin [Acetobacteraceae bacterium]|nr:type II toxin-antitoxin system VapC family toxin [Acetobacteraceae bacterium]